MNDYEKMENYLKQAKNDLEKIKGSQKDKIKQDINKSIAVLNQTKVNQRKQSIEKEEQKIQKHNAKLLQSIRRNQFFIAIIIFIMAIAMGYLIFQLVF